MCNDAKVTVGIIGATGQVGESLIRALIGHPNVRIARLTSDHAPDTPIGDLLPVLKGELDMATTRTDAHAIGAECDVVFCAKKGVDSMTYAPIVLDAGAKFIDIGGEFRFLDPAVYEKWYGRKHLCPDLLEHAVFGLPELFRDAIRSAKLIGNPGCYPTSAIVPLAPVLAAGLIEPAGLIVDAYSGLSGAGRRYSESSRNLYVDATENLRAYAIASHRHMPEMAMALSRYTQTKTSLLFTPHLAPLERGILATIYARPKSGTSLDQDAVLNVLHDAFDSEPFVRVIDDPSSVETKHTRNTNFVDVSAAVDPVGGTVILFGALDNTVKGAAGMAVQNMNLIMGLPETTGLSGRTL